MAEIQSISSILKMNLILPDYQRPYKWTSKNILDLLGDIDNAIDSSKIYPDFKYRIGTVILHEKDGELNIVDGQQRIISMLLLRLYIEPNFSCSLLKTYFKSPVSQNNINKNYKCIMDWLLPKNDEYKNSILQAFDNTLEVVVITVEQQTEAFQLFDSQNTRGRALDPHDLLKAYHLREMRDYPYEMRHAVTKWEAVSAKSIRELFSLFLYPILNWTKKVKSIPFTVNEIDVYKGVSAVSPYTYARRASKAMPYFQISEPFIAGNDFFKMAEHYLELNSDIKIEIREKYQEIEKIINNKAYTNSSGFKYACNLFYCALLCYYDKFNNFDSQAIAKMFTWAFMLRVDMENLGFDSINKYAIGEDIDRYTNKIAMFSVIANARSHHEISNIVVLVKRQPNQAESKRWNGLYADLKKLNGMEE